MKKEELKNLRNEDLVKMLNEWKEKITFSFNNLSLESLKELRPIIDDIILIHLGIIELYLNISRETMLEFFNLVRYVMTNTTEILNHDDFWNYICIYYSHAMDEKDIYDFLKDKPQDASYDILSLLSSEPTDLMKSVIKSSLFRLYLESFKDKEIKDSKTYNHYLKLLESGKLMSNRISPKPINDMEDFDKNNWIEVMNLLILGKLDESIKFIQTRNKLNNGSIGLDYFPEIEVL